MAYLRGCVSGYRLAQRSRDGGWVFAMALSAMSGALGATAAIAILHQIFVWIWS